MRLMEVSRLHLSWRNSSSQPLDWGLLSKRKNTHYGNWELQEVSVHIGPEKGSYQWTHDKLYCIRAQPMEGSCSTGAATDEPYSGDIA